MTDLPVATPPVTSPRRAGARQGLTLAFAGFLPILSILSLAPAIPTIIGHFRNVPHARFLVPMMATTPGLMVALLSPIAGYVIDRYGRRQPLLWATFAYAFSGTAPFFFTGLMAIFVSRLAVGVSETFILVTVYTLFADYFDDARRRNWLTVQGLLGPALGALSLAGSGWLSTIVWNGVFLIYGTAFVVFLAMLAWFYEPDRAIRQPGAASTLAAQPFPWRTAAVFCSVTLFTSLLYYVFLVNGAIAFAAVQNNSAATIGLILGLISLAVPLGAVVFNVLSRRLALELVLAVMLLLIGAGTAAIGLSRHEAPMIVAAVVQQIGAGMAGAGLLFWVTRLLPPEHRGRGSGLWTSSFFGAQFISPAIVGAITAASGSILSSFAILGAIGVAGAVAVAALRSRFPQPVKVVSRESRREEVS